MDYNINRSGVNDIHPYNLILNNTTILSSLNGVCAILGPDTTLIKK
jgi:hypothetical protein